ncbi:MAG: protoporphyrinogen oxidase HemJ [Bacteroidetes bacterium]|nr:protoporphyrinogen oxidase HemJ [Bacteroidota bacterium]
MDFVTYSSLKSLHLIFLVSWFAGLFYIVRLFIYHTEAQDLEENEKQVLNKQFTIMEKKLWWIITTPSMILTVTFGTIMLIGNPGLMQAPWMHVKLTFVALLIIYHFLSQQWMFHLQKGKFKHSSGKLRLWNELATLFLVSIVFLAVTKGTVSWWKATVAFFALGIGLMLLIKLYKRLTKRTH